MGYLPLSFTRHVNHGPYSVFPHVPFKNSMYRTSVFLFAVFRGPSKVHVHQIVYQFLTLEYLYLQGNQLSGGEPVPNSLYSVKHNDLASLDLLPCRTPTLTATATPAPTATAALPDRNILIALYNATDGANWTNNDYWLSEEPLGAWHGVDTDDSGGVIELNLSRNQQGGGIPSALGNLANLKTLNFSHSTLSGAILSQLGNPANLV